MGQSALKSKLPRSHVATPVAVGAPGLQVIIIGLPYALITVKVISLRAR